MDKILITGITGQDGSTLAQKLLSMGDKVLGVVRRSSTPNLKNVPSHINLELGYADITDGGAIYRLVDEFRPDIIFHFAAQSHVGVSFENPLYTLSTLVQGTANVLEAIRRIDRDIRLYNAASSEMFGCNIDADGFQRETTPFAPNSPYAVGKLAAFHLTRQYREAYGIHASSGILFNHEGPRRGYEFVTRKITRYVAALQTFGVDRVGKLSLGNIYAQRDWGFCDDYMTAAYLMTQMDTPDDYVVATGETKSVWDFVEAAFREVGLDPQAHIDVDMSLMRDREVPILRGDSSKIRSKMNWRPSFDFNMLVRIMVEHDIQEAQKLLGKV